MTVGEKRHTSLRIYIHLYTCIIRAYALYTTVQYVRTQIIACIVDNKNRTKKSTQYNTRGTRLRNREYTWAKYCRCIVFCTVYTHLSPPYSDAPTRSYFVNEVKKGMIALSLRMATTLKSANIPCMRIWGNNTRLPVPARHRHNGRLQKQQKPCTAETSSTLSALVV